MNAAENVISKFGNQSALARLLGKRPSTVQHWAAVGVIPAKWHAKILEIARANNVDLSPDDFIPISLYQKNPPGAFTKQATPRTPTVIPAAKWFGTLVIGSLGVELPCYVLDNGQRVISRTGATAVLTENKGGGHLESYIGVRALTNYIPEDLSGQMIEFTMQGVVNRTVRGITAETFLQICEAYVKALSEGGLKTARQKVIAYKASIFMASCAKIGLIALIDEVTGYQYERSQEALQVKLKAYLSEEMRKWERTFPDELWVEFGRLTNWHGSVAQRPKYWGKLVNELVYECLDPDVAKWLKENAPKPQHGQNYHQWLNSQYGLKKLVEHIWMLIGMARACRDMNELRDRMAERFGLQPIQFTFWVPMVGNLGSGSQKVLVRSQLHDVVE